MFVAYVIMCFIFGLTFLAIRVGMEAGFAPFMFAALRFSVAGVIVLFYLWLKKHEFPKTWKEYASLALVGFCNTTVSFAALYWSEQHISSGLAALLSAVSPFSVAMISILIERKQPQVWQIAGLMLGLLGVYLIVFQQVDHVGQLSSRWLQATLAMVASGVVFGFGAVFSRKIMSTGISTATINGFQMFFGSLGLFLISFFAESSPMKLTNSLAAFSSLVYLIVFGSIVAWGIYYWLVQRVNPMFPSTWFYVSPTIAMAAGALFLQEEIHLMAIMGSFTVLAGVFLTNLEDWKRVLFPKKNSSSYF